MRAGTGRSGVVEPAAPRAGGETLARLWRDVLSAGETLRARPRLRLLVQSAVAAVVSVVLVVGAVALLDEAGPLKPLESPPLDPDHWPAASPSPRTFPSLPATGSAITAPDELAYFRELLNTLEAGIANRVNIDAALQGRRPPEVYRGVLEAYRQRQEGVLRALQTQAVPRRLAGLHAHVVAATEQQLAFYTAFAEAKASDPDLTLARMLGHPALRRTSQELLAAYGVVRRLYPALDRQAHEAITARLFWLTII